MGIGVTPTKLEIVFGNDNELTLKVKLINSGNVNLRVNVTSRLNISSDKNDFILSACKCKNYCDINVVECNELTSPEDVTIILKNPRKPIVEYITFSGLQLVSGGMVTTGVSAKLRINITYNGQTPIEDPEKNSNTTYIEQPSNPSSQSHTTTTIPPTSTTTTTTTIPKAVVEPADQKNKSQDTGAVVQGNDENKNDSSLLYILLIGGGVSVPLIGYFAYRKTRIQPQEEVVYPQQYVQPQNIEYPVQFQPDFQQQPQLQFSNDPEIIDETKK